MPTEEDSPLLGRPALMESPTEDFEEEDDDDETSLSQALNWGIPRKTRRERLVSLSSSPPTESWTEKLYRTYKTRIRYYIPVLSWLPKYRWARDFRHDLVAGLTVAFLIIPQGLSYAQALVKIPPVHGLYTAFVPLLIYCLLGTSRHLGIGPEALVSILVGAAIKEWFAWRSSFPISGSGTTQTEEEELAQKIGIATLMALMVGLFTFLLGFFRFGFLDSVLSRALLRGFVLAVACVVIIDMSDTLLGLNPPVNQCLDHPVVVTPPINGTLSGTAPLFSLAVTTSTYIPNFAPPSESLSPIAKLLNTLSRLGQTHLLTALMSVASIGYLFGMKFLKQRFSQKDRLPWIKFLPDILILVVVSTGLCQLLRWDCYGVSVLNRVQSSTNYIYPKLPPLSIDSVRFLTLSSMLISVIGFVESIAAAKMYASKYNYSMSPNRELVAIGLANLASSVVGGYPAMGSLGRSAVNDSAGAKTQLAGGITGILVLIVSVWFLPFFEFLPKAVCSSIIVVAAIQLVDFYDVFFILRMRAWKDLGLLCLTFLSTLFISIESGTLISVGISLLLVVQHTTKTRIAILGQTLVLDPITGTLKSKYKAINELPSCAPLDSLMIVRIEEGLFFGNSGQLKERLQRIEVFGDLRVHPGEEPRRPRPPISGICHTSSATALNAGLRVVIFDMAAVTSIDASATQTLLEIVDAYHSRNISVCFVKLRVSCKSPFLYSGLYSLVGPNRFFNKIQDAVDHEVREGHIGTPHDWMETGNHYKVSVRSQRGSGREEGSLTDSDAEAVSSFS